MKTRIITGLIAFILFFPFLYLGEYKFLFVSMLLSFMSVYEIVKITYGNLNLVSYLSSSILVFCVFFSKNLENNYLLLLFLLLVLMNFIQVVITSHNFKIKQICVVLFMTLYISIGFYSLYMLRNIQFLLVLYLLITIWVTDSLAYFGGMKYGKNKLSPNISPNKSIEGSIIGTLCSLMVAIIFYKTTNIFSNIFVVIVITILVSVVGQLGDLIESAYKREFGVKDSSNILPGHGGIFDRFDSVILAAPMLLVLLSIL